MEGWSY